MMVLDYLWNFIIFSKVTPRILTLLLNETGLSSILMSISSPFPTLAFQLVNTVATNLGYTDVLRIGYSLVVVEASGCSSRIDD